MIDFLTVLWSSFFNDDDVDDMGPKCAPKYLSVRVDLGNTSSD